MDALKVRAYGKINLTLKVLDRRPDGFHNLSTIFQVIALQDTLTFSRCPEGINLEVKGAPLPAGPDNLVYRAAALLQQRYGFPGVRITLTKRIPLAAGLAGGSSDAAATLLGLNYLYNLGLTPGQLAREGARLGSDVPFCVLGGTALGRGRGEELYLLPPAPRLWLVLVKPPFGVSTAAVYQGWDAAPSRQNPEPPDEEKALAALRAGDREQLVRALGNDLEIVTCRLYPEVMAIKLSLVAAGAERAVLCGSGPTVFGVAPDRETAINIASRLRQTYPETIVTCTL
ncbi:MAG: 4-diphosphocytidyl-2-C-methyl-D-erythritol kinase [Moorella sp. (in: firmicutes)]|uniref:4-(cytidine 5'-diphospho)-2-C-methyl-D-erythritol kinase n=1 Tax=unclassified Neomoorella TaxID=2676739 RepID=UPI0010FFBBEC|nr:MULTISPECIES: 4-(cytidine 5'-diphospho)-2-C-methyl-D-erythritol kinase [unclassified Moorella (in: firmicutes)]MDK2816492.1 4-diphosphocytidyl-2-C-methyl-D-erythritol kinase [Moorella sp. (in: firmicutes)]MDK2894539.1 4-diphosphocytidyl-2-C-methyl-D-erythritol kinase [Moorella sp. (in: firmicutes)]GEA14546.1 4-diphosphocytidyl-2-C-methyl-D-erythritol kinase [Moorella sp. E308F]GEA18083.1 4-diphosphocytidyl-2-C-methyl-D-erythritol kinase [Moorella sp. E306M]